MLGVVVKYGSLAPFILDLEDAGGYYTWQEAVNEFGNRLPTKEQSSAWISQQEAVQSAIRAFGGNITGLGVYDNNFPENDARHYCWYWTRSSEPNSVLAWGVSLRFGNVSHFYKTYTSRVRPVIPVTEPY